MAFMAALFSLQIPLEGGRERESISSVTEVYTAHAWLTCVLFVWFCLCIREGRKEGDGGGGVK